MTKTLTLVTIILQVPTRMGRRDVAVAGGELEIVFSREVLYSGSVITARLFLKLSHARTVRISI